MAIVETRLDYNSGSTSQAGAASEHGKWIGDVGLSLAAMVGAVVGAVAGAALGAEAGSAYPVLCGGLGTMLGSGLMAGVWSVLTDLWGNVFVGYEAGHARDYATAQQSITQVSSTE